MEKMIESKRIVFVSYSMSFLLSNVIVNTLNTLFSVYTMPFLEKLLRPSVSSILLTVLLGSVVVILSLKIRYQLQAQFGDLRKGNKGTAQFSSDDDIKDSYHGVRYLPQYNVENNSVYFYKGLSGTLISRIDEIAYIDTSDSHNSNIGRTRSGKSQSKVLPDIELYSRSEEQPHLIISSTKYELFRKTALELQARGYKINILNLIDLEYSMGYNPLSLIVEQYRQGEIDTAVELCKTFSHPLYHNPNSKDPIWEETAMALVNALILALCHEFVNPDLPVDKQNPEYVNMNALVSMLIELSGSYQYKTETRYLLDEYFGTLPLNTPARREYATVGVTTGQMRSSIFGTALAKLQKFTAPKVAAMMKESTFNFSSLTQTEQPQAIFIVLPDAVETNHIIASTWIQQCYFYLSEYATHHGDRLTKRVRFVLDEFGNMPAFYSLNSMISVGAGRGMLFDFYVQDLIQLKIRYGLDVSKFVESQLMNLVYLHTTNDDTKKRFSEMLGDYEVIQKQRSGHFWSLNKTITETVEKRPLLFPNELSYLLEGECVVIRSKRKNNGQDVKPYPILNTGHKRFMMAYEYLQQVFTSIPVDDDHCDESEVVQLFKYIPDIQCHQSKQDNLKEMTAFSTKIHERLKKSVTTEVSQEIEKKECERHIAHATEQIEANKLTSIYDRYSGLDREEHDGKMEKFNIKGQETPSYTHVIQHSAYCRWAEFFNEHHHKEQYAKQYDEFKQIETLEDLKFFCDTHHDILIVKIRLEE